MDNQLEDQIETGYKASIGVILNHYHCRVEVYVRYQVRYTTFAEGI